MSPVVVRQPRAASRARTWRAVVVTGGLLLAVLLVMPLWWVLRPPAFVDGLTVVNDSVYDVHVEVTGGEKTPVLGLGTVPRGRTLDFGAVLDQGATWEFRFTYAGHDGGTFTFDREYLEREGWTLAVPSAVGEALRRQGLPPSVATRT